MYVFDVGTGQCLTPSRQPAARIYAVHRTGPHATADGGGAYALWLAREPLPLASPTSSAEDLQVGNALQLKLVVKGLRRRFGDLEEEEMPQEDSTSNASTLPSSSGGPAPEVVGLQVGAAEGSAGSSGGGGSCRHVIGYDT